jgi:hypothetical protein
MPLRSDGSPEPEPARRQSHRVDSCLLCQSKDVAVAVDGRLVTTSCCDCEAVLQIEFDPPDDPGVRARIERLD